MPKTHQKTLFAKGGFLSETRTCVSCGALNRADALWCGQCYAEFAAPPPPPPPPPSPGSRPSADPVVESALEGPFVAASGGVGWTCSMCGTTNAIGEDICTGCSVPFKASLEMGHSPGRRLHSLASSPWSGFGDRVSRGFRLIAISWRVLRLDPELMAFPAVTGLLVTVVSFLFLTIFNGLPLSALDTPEMWAIPKWQLYLLYVVIFSLSVICQAAVVACAMLRFRGQNPRLADGLSAAMRKIGPLIVWAAIAASVQLLLRWLEDAARRAGRGGRVAIQVVDIAWQVATYFAVPAIVFEDISGAGAIKRSGQIFKRTWTESLAGMLGMGAAFFVILLGALFALTPIAVLGGPAGLILALTALAVLIVAASTLSAINNAALYYYATQGDAPVPYSVGDVLGRRGPAMQAEPALA